MINFESEPGEGSRFYFRVQLNTETSQQNKTAHDYDSVELHDYWVPWHEREAVEFDWKKTDDFFVETGLYSSKHDIKSIQPEKFIKRKSGFMVEGSLKAIPKKGEARNKILIVDDLVYN